MQKSKWVRDSGFFLFLCVCVCMRVRVHVRVRVCVVCVAAGCLGGVGLGWNESGHVHVCRSAAVRTRTGCRTGCGTHGPVVRPHGCTCGCMWAVALATSAACGSRGNKGWCICKFNMSILQECRVHTTLVHLPSPSFPFLQASLGLCTCGPMTPCACVRSTCLTPQTRVRARRRDVAVEVFARWYTPVVVVAAGLIALVPSLVHVGARPCPVPWGEGGDSGAHGEPSPLHRAALGSAPPLGPCLSPILLHCLLLGTAWLLCTSCRLGEGARGRGSCPCVLRSILTDAARCFSPSQQDDWKDWCYVALVVLVAACPCALVISTPVASVCALSRAAQQVGPCSVHGLCARLYPCVPLFVT
jgi:hypothetical protein